MNSILKQNYYEFFEITQKASSDEVRRAYQVMKEAFGKKSLALYSLFDPEDVSQIQQRIEAAYLTLRDENLRLAYDLTLPSSTDPDRFGENSSLNSDSRINTKFSNGKEGVLDSDLKAFLENAKKLCTGKLLKRYREWKGIKLEDLARETRITFTTLRSIEEDYFSELPQPVYLRSYLKQYAEKMGIESTGVVEGYLKRYRKKYTPCALFNTVIRTQGPGRN